MLASISTMLAGICKEDSSGSVVMRIWLMASISSSHAVVTWAGVVSDQIARRAMKPPNVRNQYGTPYAFHTTSGSLGPMAEKGTKQAATAENIRTAVKVFVVHARSSDTAETEACASRMLISRLL
jgi:hypothetical protein